MANENENQEQTIEEMPVVQAVRVAPAEEEQSPKLRVEIPTKVEKVKKFTSAQNANFHMQMRKAKKVGLTALVKVVEFLTPNNKK